MRHCAALHGAPSPALDVYSQALQSRRGDFLHLSPSLALSKLPVRNRPKARARLIEASSPCVGRTSPTQPTGGCPGLSGASARSPPASSTSPFGPSPEEGSSPLPQRWSPPQSHSTGGGRTSSGAQLPLWRRCRRASSSGLKKPLLVGRRGFLSCAPLATVCYYPLPRCSLL